MRELTRRPDPPTYDDAQLFLRVANALNDETLMDSVRWLLTEGSVSWSGSVEQSQLGPLLHWLNAVGILSEAKLLHSDLLRDLLPFRELAKKLDPHLKDYERIFPGIRARLRHLAEVASDEAEAP